MKAASTTARLAGAALAGLHINPLSKDCGEQAKLPTLGYARTMEKLAEIFHTSPETLIAFNPPSTWPKIGNTIVVPNALPASRNYDPKLPDPWRRTLATLKVDANQPIADHIIVDTSGKVLRVLAEIPASPRPYSAVHSSTSDGLEPQMPRAAARWTPGHVRADGGLEEAA